MQRPSSQAPLTRDDILDALTHSKSGAAPFEYRGREPGLYLRFKRGQATWILKRRQSNGSRTPIHIGAWPALTEEAACEAARVAKLRFARTYGKPLKQRLMGQLLDQYEMERLSSLRSAATTGRSLRQLFADLFEREIRSITRDEMSALLEVMASTAPVHANRCFAYARAFFNWAIDRRYLGTSPVVALENFIDEPRHVRALEFEELAEVLAAAQTLDYPFGPAIELMVLLPFQREVVSTMRRADIYFDAGAWYWRRPGLVYKGEPSPSVTWRLPERAFHPMFKAILGSPPNSPFVFSGNGLTAISGWSKAKQRLDDTIDLRRSHRGLPPLAPWHLNDLRATFAANHWTLEGDPHVINRCLDRIDRFRAPGFIEWACSQDIVDICTEILERWAATIDEHAV